MRNTIERFRRAATPKPKAATSKPSPNWWPQQNTAPPSPSPHGSQRSLTISRHPPPLMTTPDNSYEKRTADRARHDSGLTRQHSPPEASAAIAGSPTTAMATPAARSLSPNTRRGYTAAAVRLDGTSVESASSGNGLKTHPADGLVLHVHHSVGRNGPERSSGGREPVAPDDNRCDPQRRVGCTDSCTGLDHTAGHGSALDVLARTNAQITGHSRDRKAPAGRFREGLNPLGGDSMWVRIPPRARKPPGQEGQGSAGIRGRTHGLHGFLHGTEWHGTGRAGAHWMGCTDERARSPGTLWTAPHQRKSHRACSRRASLGM